jgi:hypothetical protein
MTTKGKPQYFCKGCGAPTKWIEMLATGKRMLVDEKPEHRVMILADLPEGTTSNFNPGLGVMAKVYMQHWGTCPKALGFKKKGKPTKGESDAPGQHGKAHKSGQQSLI